MSDAKKLEELNQRRQKLQIEHAKVSAEVDAARREYDALRNEATKEFGTAKLPDLEVKLAGIRESNAQALKSFEASLMVGEAALADFKVKFAVVQPNAGF